MLSEFVDKISCNKSWLSDTVFAGSQGENRNAKVMEKQDGEVKKGVKAIIYANQIGYHQAHSSETLPESRLNKLSLSSLLWSSFLSSFFPFTASGWRRKKGRHEEGT